MASKLESITDRIFKPLTYLNLIILIVFASASFYVVESLVQTSIENQAESITVTFTQSIRTDILTGTENEIYRKCKGLLKNNFVLGVEVQGLGGEDICQFAPQKESEGIEKQEAIYFTSSGDKVAGNVKILFDNNVINQILKDVLIFLFVALFLLIILNRIVSKRLVQKETLNLSSLSNLLREAKIEKLENCSSYYSKKDLSLELNELVNGVENLAEKWRSYQAELVRNEKLKSVNETSRLLAHDMKSPLAAIRAGVDHISSKPEKSRELLQRGFVRIEKMLDDLVKSDEKKSSSLNLIQVKVEPFLKNIANEMVAAHPNLQLSMEYLMKDEHEILLDSDQVERAIRNLLKNCAEAAVSGAIKVNLRVSSVNKGVTILVTDNGPGLPTQVIQSIGEKDNTFKKVGGSGLGLYQVSKMASAHGGQFSVRSQPGKGAEFEIWLPRSGQRDGV